MKKAREKLNEPIQFLMIPLILQEKPEKISTQTGTVSEWKGKNYVKRCLLGILHTSIHMFKEM